MSIENNCEYAMSLEVQHMCKVAKGPDHGPAPIPEEGKWIQAKEIKDKDAVARCKAEIKELKKERSIIEKEIKNDGPAFFKGTFQAKAGIDTCLHTKGLGRGFVVINGFCIGRFWSVGPQETLYVPGGILKDGENEIIIFELHTDMPAYQKQDITINFIKKHILAGEFRDDVL